MMMMIEFCKVFVVAFFIFLILKMGSRSSLFFVLILMVGATATSVDFMTKHNVKEGNFVNCDCLKSKIKPLE